MGEKDEATQAATVSVELQFLTSLTSSPLPGSFWQFMFGVCGSPEEYRIWVLLIILCSWLVVDTSSYAIYLGASGYYTSFFTTRWTLDPEVGGKTDFIVKSTPLLSGWIFCIEEVRQVRAYGFCGHTIV